jgi:hypothetical protein
MAKDLRHGEKSISGIVIANPTTLKGIDAIMRSMNQQSLQLPYRC